DNEIFRAQVAEWLSYLSQPEKQKLRAETFTLAHEGREICENRATLFYNLFQVLREVDNAEQGQYDNNPEQLFDIGQRMYRMQLLEKIASRKVAEKQLSAKATGSFPGMIAVTEIYLAYQVRLASKLQLPRFQDSKDNYSAAFISQKEVDEAEEEIRKCEQRELWSYLQLEWAPWKTVLKRLYPQEMQEAENQALEIVADLDEYNRRIEDYIHRHNLTDNEQGRLSASEAVSREIRLQFLQPISYRFYPQSEQKNE
ncbi:MAG: NEL-type E3 ubiquitin ligase domain-containing protein, partial [Enterobacteriaceae bacterium]